MLYYLIPSNNRIIINVWPISGTVLTIGSPLSVYCLNLHFFLTISWSSQQIIRVGLLASVTSRMDTLRNRPSLNTFRGTSEEYNIPMAQPYSSTLVEMCLYHDLMRSLTKRPRIGGMRGCETTVFLSLFAWKIWLIKHQLLLTKICQLLKVRSNNLKS